MSKTSTVSKPNSDSKKVTSELFSLTYGALVTQLVKDLPSYEDVNRQLDKMGYNIGLRIVDDFLAKNPQVGKCNDFREVAEVLSKHGFRTYLGIIPTVANWNASVRNKHKTEKTAGFLFLHIFFGDEFSLIFESNPLTEFVELPLAEDKKSINLNFCQILCGALRGALEMVHLEVVCSFVQDQLKGDQNSEIRIKFVRKLEESVPAGDED